LATDFNFSARKTFEQDARQEHGESSYSSIHQAPKPLTLPLLQEE
jgi:hypothetical protein